MADQTLPQWPEWMTVSTLSRYSEISPRKLRSLMKGPRPIPTVKHGRLVRVNLHDFDTWLRGQAAAQAAPGVDDVIAELRAGRVRS